MEQGPEDVVAEPVVKVVGRLRVEVHRYTREGLLLRERFGNVGALVLGNGHADPADPRNLHVFHAEEGGDEAARRALEAPAAAVPRAARRHGQPVGDDD